MPEKENNDKHLARALDEFLAAHPKSRDLVLGVSHSDESDYYRPLSSAPVISALQKHGIHTIALESPAALQTHVEDASNNGRNAKDFAEADRRNRRSRHQ